MDGEVFFFGGQRKEARESGSLEVWDGDESPPTTERARVWSVLVRVLVLAWLWVVSRQRQCANSMRPASQLLRAPSNRRAAAARERSRLKNSGQPRAARVLYWWSGELDGGMRRGGSISPAVYCTRARLCCELLSTGEDSIRGMSRRMLRSPVVYDSGTSFLGHLVYLGVRWWVRWGRPGERWDGFAWEEIAVERDDSICSVWREGRSLDMISRSLCHYRRRGFVLVVQTLYFFQIPFRPPSFFSGGEQTEGGEFHDNGKELVCMG